MIWTTILFCNFLFGILCIILAKKQNRSVPVWFLLAIPFGILATFTLLYLQENQKQGKNEPSKDDPTA